MWSELLVAALVDAVLLALIFGGDCVFERIRRRHGR
jgi:hypothetical protein